MRLTALSVHSVLISFNASDEYFPVSENVDKTISNFNVNG